MKNLGMALLIVVIGLVAWLIVSGIHDRAWMKLPANESYARKVTRYRAGAEDALRVVCTNEVVGLRSIVSASVDTSSDNFMNWTARATADYVNHFGGVDRTNLVFKASSIGGQFYWLRQ
jgi:hypothetical protein